jgi:hypothetical protein
MEFSFTVIFLSPSILALVFRVSNPHIAQRLRVRPGRIFSGFGLVMGSGFGFFSAACFLSTRLVSIFGCNLNTLNHAKSLIKTTKYSILFISKLA